MSKKHFFRKVSVLILAVSFLAALAGCSSGNYSAENYPSKNITIIVGFNPGGGVDTAVRGIQPYLQKYIGKTVMVENRPGNQGLTAMNYVGESKPDGYTLLACTNAMTLNSMIFPEAYKLKKPAEEAMIPIYSWVNGDCNGIYVSKDSPYRTFDDLVKAAQTKGIKVGCSGVGSTDHITFITIQKTYRGKWDIVPMDSASEVVTGVLGGQLDAGSSSPAAAGMDPSRVRMLVVTSSERISKWPDVATFVEMGKPELNIQFVIGLMAPTGTPKEIIEKIETAMENARNDSEYLAWAEQSKQPIGEEGWGSGKYKQYLIEYQTNMKNMIPDIKSALDAAQGKK